MVVQLTQDASQHERLNAGEPCSWATYVHDTALVAEFALRLRT